MKSFRLLLLLMIAFTQSNVWAQHGMDVSNLKKKHPYLFADAARIAGINNQTDLVSKQLLFILKSDAEKKLLEEKIVYPGDVSNMSTSRNVQGRILSLALAYRVFGDQRFAQKAKEELLQLAVLRDWGVGHFLDVGEASLAAGIGYDWLYHELTDAERKIIADAIKNNALLPSLQVKEGAGNNTSWVNGNFNWNPVCHGGLMVGALSIAEREPALTNQIINRAIKNIPIAGDAYSPDGSFAEGPSYWSYGTSFYVLAVEALRSSLGNSAGLEKIPGFLKTADFNIQMVGATGEDFNYSDYHTEHLNEPVMLWFANNLQRPDLAEDELKSIRVLNELSAKKTSTTTSSYALPSEGSKAFQSRHTPFELLWWNPALSIQNKAIKPPLHYAAAGLMSIGVMRSSWNNSKATFVAIKGGTPDNSHGHMDAGSFILEADGVRWAVDLGTESYDNMRAAKLDLWNYTQNSSRWTTFRVGPEGHNILRFNNEKQLITGNGQVTSLKNNNGIMGNEADLSSLYANRATKVTRTILLHPNRSVSIQDNWTAKDTAVEVSFQWLTKARVTKTVYGLLLEQDDQSLQLRLEKKDMQMVVIEIEDVSKPINLQDSPNPNLSRIIIKTKTAANREGKFYIEAIPGSTVHKG